MTFLETFTSLGGKEYITDPEAKKHFAYFNDKYKYFTRDDEGSYSQFFQIARVFFSDGADDQHQFRKKTPYEMCKKAYKLLVFFGGSKIEDTLRSFDLFHESHKGDIENSEIGHYRIFAPWKELPTCSDYAKPSFNIEAWKAKLVAIGPEIINEAAYLARIEKHLGRIPEVREEFDSALSSVMYQRSGENPEMARFALEYKLKEEEFNFALNNHRKISLVPHQELPDMVIDLSARVPDYFDTNDGSNIKLKPREGDDPTSWGHEDVVSTYNRKYIVQLPTSDYRYSLICSEFFKAITSYVEPKTHGIYVVVEASADKAFDPSNIDWENLDKDNHKILLFCFMRQGPSGEIYLTQSEMSPMIADEFIYRVLGAELAKIFPGMEVLIHQQYCRSDFNEDETPRIRVAYDNDKLHALAKMHKTVSDVEAFCNPSQSLLIVSASQAQKILDLGEEYVKSLRHKEKLLAKFVLEECGSKEEILELHGEILSLEERDSAKFKLIFDLALKTLVTSNIGYKAIAALPVDILEYLNSHNFVRYNIKMEDLIAGAGNVLAVKKNFVKACLKPFTESLEVLSKIDSAEEQVLDTLLECDNLPQALRYIDIVDLIALDLPTIEKLLCEQAMYLYSHGVKCQDLVDAGNIVQIKQKILMSSLIFGMQEEGYPDEVILEISSVISKLTEGQLDFIDECDCDLLEMVKFAASHPDANKGAFERRALEVEYGMYQIVEEGTLSGISDEMLVALQDKNTLHFFEEGYVSLEAIIKLPPALVPVAVHFNMINTYNFLEVDVDELFSSADPNAALESLKAEANRLYDENWQKREDVPLAGSDGAS